MPTVVIIGLCLSSFVLFALNGRMRKDRFGFDFKMHYEGGGISDAWMTFETGLWLAGTLALINGGHYIIANVCWAYSGLLGMILILVHKAKFESPVLNDQQANSSKRSGLTIDYDFDH